MLRKSTALMKEPTMGINRKHTFNDDAGSAILDFVSVDESLAPTLVQEEGEKLSNPKYTEDLIRAVYSGSATIMDMMLQQYIDVNARDHRDGRTALSYAAELGHVEITELLLKRGAAVNIRQYSLSKRVLGRGMNDLPWMISGRMPIHWAAVNRHSAVVELFLQYGANPNARNTPGRLVLQDSCVNDDPKSVRLLLQAGADVNARSYGSVSSNCLSSVCSQTKLVIGLDSVARSGYVESY
jgi:ankyrin repeat protein